MHNRWPMTRTRAIVMLISVFLSLVFGGLLWWPLFRYAFLYWTT